MQNPIRTRSQRNEVWSVANINLPLNAGPLGQVREDWLCRDPAQRNVEDPPLKGWNIGVLARPGATIL